MAWFEDALATAIKAAPEGLSVSISYYVTDTPVVIDDGASASSDKDADEAGAVNKHTGRPNLPNIVKEFCNDEGTVAIAGTWTHPGVWTVRRRSLCVIMQLAVPSPSTATSAARSLRASWRSFAARRLARRYTSTRRRTGQFSFVLYVIVIVCS